MVIDHANAIWLHHSAMLMELMGRGAFPLFAYAVAMAVSKSETGPDKQKKLQKYLTRLLILALVSQPVYYFALGSTTANVLFTLAGGAVMAALSYRLPLWQTYILYVIALVSMLWVLPLEFGLAGIMLPSAIILAQRGCRGAYPFLFLLMVFMNAGGVLQGVQEHVTPLVWGLEALNGFFSIILLWLALDVARSLSQKKRFMTKYALYVFYPAHLLILKLLAFAI